LLSTVWITTPDVKSSDGKSVSFGSGSGSLINREAKLILTNEHVVEDFKEVYVFFPHYQGDGPISEKSHYLGERNAGRGMIGKVVAVDPLHDLALIELREPPPAKAQPLPLTNRKIGPGMKVQSVGNPGASDALWVNSTGAVRQVYQNKWQDVRVREAKVVETQSPVNPGDSGGPVVNDRAELVAVVQSGHFTRLGVADGKVQLVGTARLMTTFIHVDEVKDLLKSRGFKWVEGERTASAVVEVAKLRGQLKSPNRDVCRGAARGLVELGADAEPAVQELTAALAHKDAVVRELAARALGQIGDSAKGAAPALIKLLDDLEVRAAALKALAQLGKAATPAAANLEPLLKAPQKDVREGALLLIRSLGPGAQGTVPALIEVLIDGDQAMKLLAVEALGAIGPDAFSAAVPLGELLARSQGDDQLRISILYSLTLIGSSTERAILPIMEAAKDRKLSVRLMAVFALGKLGKDTAGDRAAIAIFEALESDSPMVQEWALHAWSMLGPTKARFAVPYLRELCDPKIGKGLATWADRILNSIDDKITGDELPIFEAVFTNKELQVHTRDYAGKVLAGHVATPKAKLSVRKIGALLSERQFAMRGRAALVLGKLGPQAAETVPAIAQLLKEDKDGETFVRLSAATALQQLGKENAEVAIPALRHALQLDVPAVKAQAARALGAIGPRAAAAVPDLARGLEEPDVLTKRQCAFALARIGPSAVTAVAPLSGAAFSEDADTRLYAIQAIGEIGPEAASAIPALFASFRSRGQFDDKTFASHFVASVLALGKIGDPAKKKIDDNAIVKSANMYEAIGAALAIEKMNLSKESAKSWAAHISRYLLARMPANHPDPEFREFRRMVIDAINRLKERSA
jgi:HEAT repeat protein